jgi:hypothetical protein
MIYYILCYLILKYTLPDIADCHRPQLKGGGLSGKFELKTFHFHWGKYNGRRSEHTINGRQNTMEVTMIDGI